MENLQLEISVFSLNIWGLPSILSKNRAERFIAVSTALNKLDYDIVCFQELWKKSDYRTLKRRISGKYPFQHFYYSGVYGSGLCIFSKWPIVTTFFLRFSINGYFHMIHHADWYGGKGIALAQININGFIINIYNFHLHANYNETADRYLIHRLIQSYETGELIKFTSNSANAVIVAGDSNSEPKDLCTKVIRIIADLTDSYDFEKVGHQRGTNDCPSNSYSSKKSRTHPSYVGQRIDYILFKAVQGLQMSVESYMHPLEDKVPGCTYSYSDHEAVGCKFRVTPSTDMKVSLNHNNNNIHIKEVINESISVCNQALLDLKKNQIFYFISIVIIFLAIILLSTILVYFGSYFSEFGLLIFSIIFQFSLFCMAIFFFFALIMLVWHQVEVNTIKSTRKRMKNYL